MTLIIALETLHFHPLLIFCSKSNFFSFSHTSVACVVERFANQLHSKPCCVVYISRVGISWHLFIKKNSLYSVRDNKDAFSGIFYFLITEKE